MAGLHYEDFEVSQTVTDLTRATLLDLVDIADDRNLVRSGLPATGGSVDEATSKAWLQGLGFRTPSSHEFRGSLDLAAITHLHRPLVMKGVSGKIAHESDHGLVALGLRTDTDLMSAYDRVRTALAQADPLGQIALSQPRLQSLDINPVLVQPDGEGVVAVDAKLFLAA